MVLASNWMVVAQDRVRWLRDNVVDVRSIDPEDRDYSDLEPLVGAIGDARIVQLGESSHGAGSAFSAKVRLIQFLHQRLGFDVLVWESGMYDCRIANEALRAGEDAVQAGRRGIFGIWSGVTEVTPLLVYAQRSHAGQRPLEIAGFDMQFSGSPDRFAQDLRSHFEAIPEATVRERGLTLAAQAIAARAPLVPRGEQPAPVPADLQAFIAAADALVAFAAEHDATLHLVHPALEVDFMRRAMENFRIEGENRYVYAAAAEGTPAPEALNAAWNRRDTRNADNLSWLADVYYRGRKLIVWAHNGHIMNAYYRADWSALAATPQDGGMKPVGVFLDETRGDEVYTVGFTAFAGEHRVFGEGESPEITPAPEGSLEHSLHALGLAHAFLDFRRLDASPEHWLRQPSTMAIRGYLPEVMPDWTRVVDAVFFNALETPSTPIEANR